MKNSWLFTVNSCSPTQWILQLAAIFFFVYFVFSVFKFSGSLLLRFKAVLSPLQNRCKSVP